MSDINIEAIAAVLTNKVNLDFGNASYQPTKLDKATDIYSIIKLKEIYNDGLNGYRIWSNGYCEQWGRSSALNYCKSETITLPKTYRDTNFSIVGAAPYEESAGDKGDSFALIILAENQVQYYSGFEQGSIRWVFWQTAGMLADGQY